MSRHYNTKHPDRVRKVTRAFGKLAGIEGRTGLRARQMRRVMQTCTLKHDHSGVLCLIRWDAIADQAHKHTNRCLCNGSPFPRASEIEDLAIAE